MRSEKANLVFHGATQKRFRQLCPKRRRNGARRPHKQAQNARAIHFGAPNPVGSRPPPGKSRSTTRANHKIALTKGPQWLPSHPAIQSLELGCKGGLAGTRLGQKIPALWQLDL